MWAYILKIFERAYTVVTSKVSGVNGSLRRCSSDDFVEGHDGHETTYIWHEAISLCISGLVKIRTSYLKSHFMIFTAFILRCCIVNIEGIYVTMMRSRIVEAFPLNLRMTNTICK